MASTGVSVDCGCWLGNGEPLSALIFLDDARNKRSSATRTALQACDLIRMCAHDVRFLWPSPPSRYPKLIACFEGSAWSLRPRVLERRAGRDQAAFALCRHGFHQRERGVAHLLLKRVVAIERLVARRIGLVVAHISIKLAIHAG